MNVDSDNTFSINANTGTSLIGNCSSYTWTPQAFYYPTYPAYPLHVVCKQCSKNHQVTYLYGLPTDWLQIQSRGVTSVYCSNACAAKALIDGR